MNVLSQIELNSSFPQNATINKICDALEIPVSYLLFFSLDEQDVPQDKRSTFNVLNGAIKNLLLDSN